MQGCACFPQRSASRSGSVPRRANGRYVVARRHATLVRTTLTTAARKMRSHKSQKMGVTPVHTPSARSPTAGTAWDSGQDPLQQRTRAEFECQAIRGHKRQTRQRNAAQPMPIGRKCQGAPSWPEKQLTPLAAIEFDTMGCHTHRLGQAANANLRETISSRYLIGRSG